ncbi:MAG: hypothetical protein A3G41_06410 [Elusimicrobia bacterium RIFCSPLOWO2_12_FULL_59_9]|nr:MAG: hypothetical protein A3G41_06410 [Elusimicrobia bacterium RIFCSPLOWO2_12_FULL_59_9]
MRQTGGFGGVLARIRRERGFPSAHAFYRSRDGRRSLGLSFRNYLNLEQGKSLPKAGRLEAILAALGLPENAPQARELARAYFNALGMDALLRLAEAPQPAAPDLPAWKLGELAAHLAVRRRTVQLSVEQWKLLARDFEANTCHIVLGNTAGWLSSGELAKTAGLSPGSVRRALKALDAAGLAELSGGRARSPLAHQYWEAPPFLPRLVGINASLRRHVERWIEAGKPAVVIPPVTARLTQTNVEGYARHLSEAVNLAAVYGDEEPTGDSAVYLVRGQVFKIFPR